MDMLRTLWRTNRKSLLAFCVALLLAAFFAGRLLVQTIYWEEHRNMAVQPWMTVGYVARSWGLDPLEIDRRAGLPLPEVKGKPQTLLEIAVDRGVPVSEIIDLVEAARDALLVEDAAREAGDGGKGP